MWRTGKINETDYNKIEAIKPKQNKQIQAINRKQKEIMDNIVEMLDNMNYLLQKDIIVKGYTKKLVSETIRNDKILDIYGLQRTRTNNKLKERFGIENVGNPAILINK